MQQVDHIFHLIEQKYSYSLQRDPTRATHVPYMTGMQHAIKHIEQKISANRTAYLEDELGDILWDFCNMIFTLQKEGYIDSYHNVRNRALDKYEERVGGIQNGVSPEHTQGLQKTRLFQEQVLKNT